MFTLPQMELDPSYLIWIVLSLIAFAPVVFVFKWISNRIQYIGENEQLLVKQLTQKVIVNGPSIYFPSPLTTLSYNKRKGIALSELEYIIIKDEKTGDLKQVKGPLNYLLQANEEAMGGVQAALTLAEKEYIQVKDRRSGEVKLVKGPSTYFPSAWDTVDARKVAMVLQKLNYVKISDSNSGEMWIEKGPKTVYVEPHWQLLSAVCSGYSLKSNQQVRLRDQLSGVIRVERGEQLVFPGPYEEPMEAVQEAIDLKQWEYTLIQDLNTGKIRVEKGEKLLWIGGNERVVGQPKNRAVSIDTEHAALVRNRSTGVLTLVEKPQLFTPSEFEEVVEVRELIKLADNEAVILKDEEGKYNVRYGNPSKGTERSFFLPPYWEIVTLNWSRGRRREIRDLKIKIFDTRPQYMSFEFNCRTSDNVEMILEGTFFWEVVSIPDMLKFTGDAPGDVCAHARSCFIQLISKVTLQEFMDTFNEIAKAAHSNDDSFYSKRGIKIHSLEVTRYECADESTAAILEQIIMETTNRMNRLSCQESENEVQLAKLHGSVEQENAKTAVLKIQQQHAIESARAEGKAEAEKCVAFMQDISNFKNGTPELAIELFHALKKAEALANVSQGNASVYFTPQDANLTIHNR